MINERNGVEKSRLVATYAGLKSGLQFMGIEVSDYQPINYGLQFAVSIDNWSGKIRIYQNKKGILNIDYSQLGEGENATKIRAYLEGNNQSSNLKIKTKVNPNTEIGFPIIGTDESGKGDYFGPLVSAGVYVDKNTAKELIVCGVKDSKKLSDNKNLELSKKITEICKGHYVIIEISPIKYNELYSQFKKENKNLNTLLAWGHAKAIEETLNKVDCDLAIADQFADEKFILGKLQEKGKGLKLIQMHKAEQNVAVAAASILARARYLEKRLALSQKYNIEFPKGASKLVVECAKTFISINGEESLKNVAKLHFKTTNDILNH